jgi:hypothetical protein
LSENAIFIHFIIVPWPLQGSASLLSYTPKNQMDYGTVLCMATNLVGRQVVPCVFHVIPAGWRDLQVDPSKDLQVGLHYDIHKLMCDMHSQMIVKMI